MMGFLIDAFWSIWYLWIGFLRPLPFWDPYGAFLVPLLLTAMVAFGMLPTRDEDAAG